ncbi:hypothetical protein VTJ49DRAFT_2198 [Mycothermus thermophilus]|uniref:Uncharacterized protein n=1 Tax=Humicola insolens TaxID=85995 RepID=A0ABR3VAJ1_HUMIN
MAQLSLPLVALALIALFSFLVGLSRQSRSSRTQARPSLGKIDIKKQDGAHKSQGFPSQDGEAGRTPTSTSWPDVEPLTDFDWTSTPPAIFRPFKPVFNITMAIQASTPSNLITIDRNYLDRVTSRRRLIAAHGPAVVGVLPTARAVQAVRDLYAYLLGFYLPRRFPSMFELTPGQIPEPHEFSSSSPTSPSSDLREKLEKKDRTRVFFHNKITHRQSPLNPPPSDPLEMLRILGETVEDDLFLVLRDGSDSDPAACDGGGDGGSRGQQQQHRAVAFVCCHPAGFDPSEKLGKRLVDIHAPVPGYEKIQASMERFFGRLEVGRPVRRVNWGIQTHPNLYAPASHAPPQASSAVSGASSDEDDSNNTNFDMHETHLRVELQTLTRLPRSTTTTSNSESGHDRSDKGPILFSFKTHLYPLTALRAEGHGPDLADAIEGLRYGNAPAMWEYKGAERWGRGVCEFLRS